MELDDCANLANVQNLYRIPRINLDESENATADMSQFAPYLQEFHSSFTSKGLNFTTVSRDAGFPRCRKLWIQREKIDFPLPSLKSASFRYCEIPCLTLLKSVVELELLECDFNRYSHPKVYVQEVDFRSFCDLKTLTLAGFSAVTTVLLPETHEITHLYLRCGGIQSLSTFKKVKNLHLRGCSCLFTLEDLCESSVKLLSIDSCGSLGFRPLQHLDTVHLSRQKVRKLSVLSHVREIALYECEIKSLVGLVTTQSIILSNCYSLVSLNGLENVPFVQVEHCPLYDISCLGDKQKVVVLLSCFYGIPKSLEEDTEGVYAAIKNTVPHCYIGEKSLNGLRSFQVDGRTFALSVPKYRNPRDDLSLVF